MCNHKPVTIYQDGGTCDICAHCGLVLKPWRARGESGQCMVIFFLTLGDACIAYFFWYCLFAWTGERVLADTVATIIFLAIFALAMKLCEGGGK